MKDVLTTASAARLLGVSTRTAQLWVESGQLPSWKTPGGHRRIPRDAVLKLIDNPEQAPLGVRAHAIVLAGEGRGSQWELVGLPGSGLMVDVTENIERVREELTAAPPMLVVIEKADEAERKKLVAMLGNDLRFAKTTVVGTTEGAARAQVVSGTRQLKVTMLPDVAATSAAVVECLRATAPEEHEPAAFPRPWNEPARLEALKRSGLVGSAPDASLDRLVRLAAHATHAPVAMFTLITRAEQQFKSRVGFDGSVTPRDWAFCNETLVANELTVIEDLSKDDAFAHNPTLLEPYGFRFYAGAPVRDPLGFVLGTTCVIDVMPRRLSTDEREALTTIAEAASNLIHLRALERDMGDPATGRG